jgi:hypothetical protein
MRRYDDVGPAAYAVGVSGKPDAEPILCARKAATMERLVSDGIPPEWVEQWVESSRAEAPQCAFSVGFRPPNADRIIPTTPVSRGVE